MAGSESVEKLEDGIVRSAEQVSAQIRATKDAISTVIFGQDRVGRFDNFRSTDGFSLAATQVAARLKAELNVEVSVRDNRAGTKLPGISDGAGQSDPALFFGLGEINGTPIGGFALRHGIPETDGNAQTLLTRTLAAPAWRVPTSTLVSNAPQLYSWGASAATGLMPRPRGVRTPR